MFNLKIQNTMAMFNLRFSSRAASHGESKRDRQSAKVNLKKITQVINSYNYNSSNTASKSEKQVPYYERLIPKRRGFDEDFLDFSGGLYGI